MKFFSPAVARLQTAHGTSFLVRSAAELSILGFASDVDSCTICVPTRGSMALAPAMRGFEVVEHAGNGVS